MSLSKELRSLLHEQQIDRYSVGDVSEVRAFSVIKQLPYVARVEPTIPGSYYDADVTLIPTGNITIPFVCLEVKTSRVGVNKYYDKVREEFKRAYGVTLDKNGIESWLHYQNILVLVAGEHIVDTEDIVEQFYNNLIKISQYHAASPSKFDFPA